MKTNVLTESRYTKLVNDIRKLIEEGRKRATRAAGEELVVTYWEIGRRICQEGLSGNAGYNMTVLEDIADELDVDRSTLHRCVHFFQVYKSAPRSTNLNWSHYKHLIPIRSNQERKWYEQMSENKDLNRNQLAKAIKDRQYEQHQRNKGKKVTRSKIKRPTEPTYIYKAIVDRVIDGDTLLLRFDLGFQVWKEQRIRLAEIDTPPIDEQKGREAFRFVQTQLTKAPFVMVKTNKIDIYGRYVGHVFYSLKNLSKEEVFLKGQYLNHELVEKGLARVL